MAVRPELQPSLPLAWAAPSASLPEPTQADVIAALADLMLQLWELNEPAETPA